MFATNAKIQTWQANMSSSSVRCILQAVTWLLTVQIRPPLIN